MKPPPNIMLSCHPQPIVTSATLVRRIVGVKVQRPGHREPAAWRQPGRDPRGITGIRWRVPPHGPYIIPVSIMPRPWADSRAYTANVLTLLGVMFHIMPGPIIPGPPPHGPLGRGLSPAVPPCWVPYPPRGQKS